MPVGLSYESVGRLGGCVELDSVPDRLNVKAPSLLVTVAVLVQLVPWSISVMVADTSRVGGHGPNTEPTRLILV